MRRALLAAIAIRRALRPPGRRKACNELDGAYGHPYRPRRLWLGQRQLANGCHGDRRHGECRRPTAGGSRARNHPIERDDPPASSRLCAPRTGRAARLEGQGRADRGLPAARVFPTAVPDCASRSRVTRRCSSTARASCAILHNFLQQVEGGRSQAVGIVGEPGIGKSRLVAEFHRQLAGGRVTWVEGRCVSYGTAIPFWLLLDLLRSNCGIVEADAPEVITAKVRAGLQEVGMDPEQDSPVLLHLLGVQEVGDCAGMVEPRSGESQGLRNFPPAVASTAAANVPWFWRSMTCTGSTRCRKSSWVSGGECARRPHPDAGHLSARIPPSVDRQVLCGANPTATAVARRQPTNGSLGAQRESASSSW